LGLLVFGTETTAVDAWILTDDLFGLEGLVEGIFEKKYD